MNKQQAVKIVKDTFESDFEKEKFSFFIKNLLNHYEESYLSYQGQYIYEAFRPYISKLERIGKYTDGEHKTDILIVKLKKFTSLERARTMQRNYIAQYLKDSRGGQLRDAALVAFISPDEEDWRFSLVKMDYRFEEGKKGKEKVKEEFTSARRWSFLVGRHENSHTAQSRFMQFIADDEHNPSLKQLEEAFDIEKVTREFFEKYHDLFLRVKEALDDIINSNENVKADFEAKGVNSVDFSKKLLGQIVFLYFLQKKGWFGIARDAAWGSGPKNFLRELFLGKHRTYGNFFNEVLEPLFYEALRYDRGHDDNYYGSLNCKIPFLNGGLFDPINDYDWAYKDINFPNELFSNNLKNKEGDIGSGILDVFDRFNFTVKEDEPLDKEVAIDPEMLGKVFENLLEVKDRKSKGTYYTPRAIVHYMCQQSLINYLFTELNNEPPVFEKVGDKQLNMIGNETKQGQLDITIKHQSSTSVSKEDIEFLIIHGDDVIENEAVVERKGEETKTYSYKIPPSIRNNAKLIDQKLADIKVCDPAVGSGAFLVSMMTEIIKARNILSYYIKDHARTIYRFKRDCIEKSLYGVDIDPGAVEIARLRLWLSLIVDEEDIKKIRPLPNLDYKVVRGNSLLGYPYQRRGLEKLETLKAAYFNETDPQKKQALRVKIDLELADIFKNTKQSLGYQTDFDFRINYSEVFNTNGGFNVVIANPPYISAWTMEKEDPSSRKNIKKALYDYSFLRGHWDLYIAFIAKGHQILQVDGNLTYIIPNPILREKYATEVRKFVLQKMILISILEFNKVNVFEKVSRRTSVLIALKRENDSDYEINVYSNSDNNMITQSNQATRDSWLGLPRSIYQIKGSLNEEILLKKIEQASSRIGNFFYVNYGAQVSSKKKGSFGKKDVVSKNPRGNAKQFYEGKDVQRWSLLNRGLWLDYRPTEMYGPRNPILFEQNKIAIRKVSNKNHYLAVTLDTTKRYTDDGVVLLVPYASLAQTGLQTSFNNYSQKKSSLDLKYVLAILLSKLESFYFSKRFATKSLQGLTSHTYPTSVRALIIKDIVPENQKPLINIVDKILALTNATDYLQNSTKQARVRSYEKHIDQLVFQLYDLTEEEIAIVERNK